MFYFYTPKGVNGRTYTLILQAIRKTICVVEAIPLELDLNQTETDLIDLPIDDESTVIQDAKPVATKLELIKFDKK